MNFRRRSVLLSVSAVACVSAAAVYVAFPGSDEVAVPSPTAKAAARCRALHQRLPGTVDGLGGHALEPASDLTAGWGDPTVVLRCGVARPEVLTPGSDTYDPTVQGIEVNGVLWLTEQRDDGYRFVTTGREAFVEVIVPGKYAPEINPLTDLASAIKKTVPTEL